MRHSVKLLSILAMTAACARPSTREPVPFSGTFDVIIENGRLVDGTGAAWFYGDIAIQGDRIARIAPRGLLRDLPARHRVDATGLVVAPGFIDIQSHSRGAFLSGDGRVVSKITQGITTEIMGEGSTNAPANRWTLSSSGRPSANALAGNASFPFYTFTCVLQNKTLSY